MTISVFASLVPKPEHVADVEAELKRMVAATRAEVGNRRYDLFRQADGEAGFHLFEAYADQAAIDAHRTSAHFLAYRAKMADWLSEPPAVKVLLAIDAQQE
ncbi:putative quinol monooxygenase [Paludibacterium yongneupense]|uniref:putative quinol monooxygenase n=1 Tax=Paludibacterium yongneupense TaxID=400061 RepID=UPI0004252EC5|nr:putative quinol monooxygenase [Paludibacterium yongneupense]